MPLSLTGLENIDWGIRGVGGDGDFNESGHTTTINSLMSATNPTVAVKTVTTVTNVVKDGSIHPYTDTTANFVDLPAGRDGTQITTIVFPFPSFEEPGIYVQQTLPLDYDFTKDAKVTFTFIVNPYGAMDLSPGTARFDIGVSSLGQQSDQVIKNAIVQKITPTRNKAYSLSYIVKARANRRLLQDSPVLIFKLWRNNTNLDNFLGNLYLSAFQVSYTKK